MPASRLPLAAVADAGPLIHLDELGVPDILAGFDTVLVPSVVATEAERHRPAWAQRVPPCVRVSDPAAARLRAIREDPAFAGLDPGEVAALALWLDYRDAVLLCDDLAARRQAASMGCEVAGTLGILLWAARVHMLPPDRARMLVEDIPRRSTLHIRPALLQDAVRSLRLG